MYGLSELITNNTVGSKNQVETTHWVPRDQPPEGGGGPRKNSPTKNKKLSQNHDGSSLGDYGRAH